MQIYYKMYNPAVDFQIWLIREQLGAVQKAITNPQKEQNNYFYYAF